MGPGDDCAVLTPARGRQLCVTTDAVVEDVHFTRAHFSLADVGHKALAVNLSDLAAMGARPAWFVCAIAGPRDLSRAQVRALGRGMGALAREHRVALVGGNFTGAAALSITITATGEVAPGRALLRGGARAGDALYVSGELGDARVALEVLRGELPARGAMGALRRQRRPTPRVALGLVAARFASAAIDLSDGLAQDLGHLCQASGVGATLALERLPTSRWLRRVRSTPALDALRGGEDYELLLAVPPSRARAFERACAQAGAQVTRIGQVEPGRGVRVVGADGAEIAAPRGFDHFPPARRASERSRS